MTYAYTATERKRVSFGKIPEAMELPNLISVQRESFERFKDAGLREAFKESSPIQSQNHVLEVTFGEHQFGDPAHTVEECREKDMTYQAPLLTDVRLTNKETGEIKEQLVFMGDFPMMTDQGTFIINGTERIVVSQLVRSPGVYYSSDNDICARFSSLSNKFRTAGDSHLQILAASLMGPEDVVLFISYSGATRDMLETLRTAKASGAKIILLTHYEDSPGAKLADIVLLCGAQESPLDSGNIPVKVALLYVAEVLVLRYTMDDPENANAAQDRTSEALAGKML